MQIIQDTSIFTNLKLKQTHNTQNSLVLTQPFYIDRRTRTPIIHSPRCLNPHKAGQLNQSSNTSRKKQQKTKYRDQQSIKSTRIQNSELLLQWNANNTKNFKEKIKYLLRQYYKIREKQKYQLKSKVQTQRLQQVIRISKSIQKLLLSNKKMYNFIKSKYQNDSLRPINNDKKNQFMNQLHPKQLNKQNLSFIQNFSNLFINQAEKRSINQNLGSYQKLINFDNYSKSIQGLQKVLDQFQSSETNKILVKKLHDLNIKNRINSCNRGDQAYNNKNHKTSREKFDQKQLQQIFIEWSKGKQNIQFERNLNNFQNSQQLCERFNCGDSGTDKFYSVIKELITRNKTDKYDNYQRRKGIISQEKHISKQDIQKLKKLYQKPYTKKHSAELSQNNLKSSMLSMNTKNLKIAELKAKQLRKNKQFQKKEQKKLSQNKRKNNKSKQQKSDKKQRQISRRAPKTLKNNRIEQQQTKQKKQKRTRKIKIGLNYAKFIGRLMKSSQNQKLLQHGRLSKFRKINTRQTFLKKNRNKLSLQYIQQQTSKDQTGLQKIDQIKSNKNLNESIKNQSLSQQGDKKCRMTKYQQARLMYNMRNIKYRELSINFNSYNNSLSPQFNSQRKKRPSFCNLLGPESQNKIKSKRGSFNRRKNDQKEQFDQLRMSNQVVYGTRIHLPFQCSNKLLNLCSQTQLAKLTTFQQFDLQAVKSNITSYLRKVMQHNQKARQLYNFLMFMQQSRKITLQQQEVNCSLDQLKIQKQQDEIKKIVCLIQPSIDEYQGCNNLYQYYNWNQKDMLMTNKKFLDKLDARSIQLLYWNNQERIKMEDLAQCSLKQIQNLHI